MRAWVWLAADERAGDEGADHAARPTAGRIVPRKSFGVTVPAVASLNFRRRSIDGCIEPSAHRRMVECVTPTRAATAVAVTSGCWRYSESVMPGMCVTRTCASSTLCAAGSGRPLPAIVSLGMHMHLRAWRLHKKMSQEQVANMLGKKHSTVGRWERGLMKLSTADLQALAQIYGVTTSQLAGPPESADLIAILDRMQAIADRVDPEALEPWLQLGERLPPKA